MRCSDWPLACALVFALALGGCSSSDSSSSPDPNSSGVDGGEDGSALQDAPEQSVPSSHGQGGVSCESRPDLGGGRSACQSTASGTQYRLVEPQGGSGPYSLGLYLHGDGARAYNSNSAVKKLLSLADQKHLLLIAVLAPNKCSWWQKPDMQFDQSCNASSNHPDTEGVNAQALDNVIQAVRAGYDVRDAPYLYYGASGGSIFLTRAFFPKYGNTYPGAMAIMCGGEVPPESMFTWDPHNEALRGLTRFSFTYGDKDQLAQDSHEAMLYYQNLGFPAEEKIIPDAGHCEFDAHGRALEVWQQYLQP